MWRGVQPRTPLPFGGTSLAPTLGTLTNVAADSPTTAARWDIYIREVIAQAGRGSRSKTPPRRSVRTTCGQDRGLPLPFSSLCPRRPERPPGRWRSAPATTFVPGRSTPNRRRMSRWRNIVHRVVGAQYEYAKAGRHLRLLLVAWIHVVGDDMRRRGPRLQAVRVSPHAHRQWDRQLVLR